MSNCLGWSSYWASFLSASSANFVVCTHFATLSYHACIQPIIINVHIKMKPSTGIHGLSVIVTASLVGINFKYMVQKISLSTSLSGLGHLQLYFDFCVVLSFLLQLRNLNNFSSFHMLHKISSAMIFISFLWVVCQVLWTVNLKSQ